MECLKRILITLCFFPIVVSAEPYYGAQFTYTGYAKEPPSLHGYQFFLSYDPDCIQWRNFNIYFDLGFSHFWVTKTPYYTTLNIYSLAPVIRSSFRRRGYVRPYIEISFGVSYLNHTRLDSRNLGIHFAFQDRIGVGALLGSKELLSLGVHALHYSNARLSFHNSGISVPLMLDIGYRFN